MSIRLEMMVKELTERVAALERKEQATEANDPQVVLSRLADIEQAREEIEQAASEFEQRIEERVKAIEDRLKRGK